MRLLREIKDTVQAALQSAPLGLGALASLLQTTQPAVPPKPEISALTTATSYLMTAIRREKIYI